LLNDISPLAIVVFGINPMNIKAPFALILSTYSRNAILYSQTLEIAFLSLVNANDSLFKGQR
jgi:hypothetical protein